MKHLGLDLSLRAAGIVVLDTSIEGTVEEQVVHKEVYGYGLSKEDPESVHVGRMLSIATVVCRVAREHDVDDVYLEGSAFNQKGQLFHLGGLHFVVQTQLKLARRLGSTTVVASSARKKVLGAGRKGGSFKGDTKEWVAHKLQKIYGVDLGDNDLNDALVQCLYAHSIASEAEAEAK
jgi:hypothetical protein